MMSRSSRELERFAGVVEGADDDIELDVAALLIGAWEHEDFDVEPHRRALDQLAARAERTISGATRDGRSSLEDAAGPWAAARALAVTLFSELGFRGNADDYYDPRNSFLGEVIDRRVGIPITLSVLYLEVARRIGVRAAGVGFPGHFLVRIDGGPVPLILDPFDAGAELGRPDLESLLARASGPEARLDESALAAAPKRGILTRMLNNLAGIYGRSGDHARSLEILERIALVDAGNVRVAAALDRLRRQIASLN